MITTGGWAWSGGGGLLLAAHNTPAPAPPFCLSQGWSIVSSAATDSTFAGVLAGFVFLGVATLVTRPNRWNTHALGLLSCSFVVLGFDSYLFSLVAGSNSDSDCARVWGEALPACGMLAVGGLAVVTGISWLLVVRERAETPNGTLGRHEVVSEEQGDGATRDGADWPDVRLDSIARAMAHGVAFTLALLLATTTIDYGQYGFPRGDGSDVQLAAYLSAALVFAMSVGLTIYRRKRDVTRVVPIAYLASSYGVLVYAVACTVFIGFVTNTSAAHSAISFISLFLGLIAPATLLVALVQSIAPLSSARDRKPDPFWSRIWRLSRSLHRLDDIGEPVNTGPK